MRLGDTIKVYCSDNGKTVDGVLHKLSKDALTVVLAKGGVTISMVRKGKTNLFVGSKGGLEFTVTLTV